MTVDLNDAEDLNRQLQAVGGIFHTWRDGWGQPQYPVQTLAATGKPIRYLWDGLALVD